MKCGDKNDDDDGDDDVCSAVHSRTVQNNSRALDLYIDIIIV